MDLQICIEKILSSYVKFSMLAQGTACSPEIAPGRSSRKSRSKVHHLEGEKGIGMDCSWGGGEWRSEFERVSCGQKTSEHKELSISHCGNILNPLCDSKSLTIMAIRNMRSGKIEVKNLPDSYFQLCVYSRSMSKFQRRVQS